MDSENGDKAILSVSGLRTYFFTKNGTVKAVDDISFDLRKGEILCIVGESGSGKTVTALSLLRLIEPPGRIVEGKIMFEEKNLLDIPISEMQKIRGNRIAMIFQDPHSSLNPVLTIGEQITEAMTAHRNLAKSEAKAQTIELLRLVEIPEPERRFHEYPHQFSGGMKQRVMVAMALACEPSVLIADEPTTALDLTIQAQILDLFMELRKKFSMSIIYITHDLGVVSELADRIAVMYGGRIMEKGRRDDVLKNPLHPYTRGLIDCLLSESEKLASIPGTIPNLIDLPEGCIFHPRCISAMDICRTERPGSSKIETEHYVYCFRYGGR
ncbi:MAG: ABC transporter ATP-binding protein [Candidatus Methanoperedens sp.]|nr:ABC transporter ATP-binding protein [Candidatus Methanoperedens sp.]